MAQYAARRIGKTKEGKVGALRNGAIECAVWVGKQVVPVPALSLGREKIEIIPEVSETETRQVENKGDENRNEDYPADSECRPPGRRRRLLCASSSLPSPGNPWHPAEYTTACREGCWSTNAATARLRSRLATSRRSPRSKPLGPSAMCISGTMLLPRRQRQALGGLLDERRHCLWL